MFSSCGEEERISMPDPTSSSTTYRWSEAVFVKQTSAAENATLQWSVFPEFKTTLASLPKANLNRMRTQTKKLTNYSDSLRKEIPTPLQTLPISTRLDVVYARVALLNMTANNLQVDSLELRRDFEESLTAFNMLLHQINEKFEKDRIQMQENKNFSQEIEQRHRDSIFKIEQAKQKQLP